MRKTGKVARTLVVPIAILMLIIGWILMWTGSETNRDKPKPTPQTDATIVTTILQRDYEEIKT